MLGRALAQEGEMMSHIQNAKMFVNAVGPFQCCPGMQKLIDLGIIRIDTENVDEKGFSYCVSLIGPKDQEMWIPYCPICGKKVFSVLVPVGECFNPDLPDNRTKCPKHHTEYECGPDGPWCRKCSPNAPAKFAAEEEMASQVHDEEEELFEEELFEEDDELAPPDH